MNLKKKLNKLLMYNIRFILTNRSNELLSYRFFIKAFINKNLYK